MAEQQVGQRQAHDARQGDGRLAGVGEGERAEELHFSGLGGGEGLDTLEDVIRSKIWVA